MSFHDRWCQHIQAVDIPAIRLCLDALGHCNFASGFREVQVKSGTGLEQIHSYFKLELSGESLKKVIEVIICDIRRQGYTIQMVLAEFSFLGENKQQQEQTNKKSSKQNETCKSSYKTW